MPTFYSIDPVHRLVMSGGRAPLTFGEMVHHAEALRRDPRFDPDLNQILDFRGIRLKVVGGAGMRALASLNPFSTRARRAAVVDSSLIFGLMRMYQGLTGTDPANLRLFAEMSEALDWLGLDPGIVWPDPPDAVFTDPGDPAAG